MEHTKLIHFIEKRIRTLSTNDILVIFAHFDLNIVDGHDVDVSVTRESLITKLSNTVFNYYSISRQNCSQEEEMYGSHVLDLWIEFWEYV